MRGKGIVIIQGQVIHRPRARRCVDGVEQRSQRAATEEPVADCVRCMFDQAADSKDEVSMQRDRRLFEGEGEAV